MAITTQLDQFKHLLLPLEQQLELMKSYNSKYWGDYFASDELGAVDTDSDHEQRVDDLEILHVQFGSLKETIIMWWAVFMGEQPKCVPLNRSWLDFEQLCLHYCNRVVYRPRTINPIRINLVSHWEPRNGRTLEQVRESARVSDEILAQLEIMSTYGLHRELFRCQDGDILPYTDIGAITIPSTFRQGLGLCWKPLQGGGIMNPSGSNFPAYRWATPTILQNP